MQFRVTRRYFLAGSSALLLSGCGATLNPVLLTAISDKIDPGKVDFADLLAEARRSFDAHKTDAEIKAARPGVVRVTTVEPVKIRYFIEVDPKTGVQHVALPGSANLTNWVTDINAISDFIPSINFTIHRGFEKAAIPTYRDLVPYLHKDRPIRLTGHSLGGAMAAIIGGALQKQGYNVTRVVTFGQPRITNGLGVIALSKLPLTRVVNALDPVSMIPGFPFVQFGEEVILLPGPDYIYLSKRDAATVSVGEYLRSRKQVSASYHDLQLYIDNLAGKVKQHRAVPYANRLLPQG